MNTKTLYTLILYVLARLLLFNAVGNKRHVHVVFVKYHEIKHSRHYIT